MGSRYRELAPIPKDQEVSKDGVVLYWMQRDCRAHDNWAMLEAQKRAKELNLPLLVVWVFGKPGGVYPLRRLKFVLAGLKLLKNELAKFNINFYLLAHEKPSVAIESLIATHKVSLIVTDQKPLRNYIQSTSEVTEICRNRKIGLIQVDAHNVIPVWITSDHMEVAARTIRPKIHRLLADYLVEFPELEKHPIPHKNDINDPKYIADFDDSNLHSLYKEIAQDLPDIPDWATPGEEAGRAVLAEFCKSRLEDYAAKRNDPSLDMQSRLSLWFNTGQLSAQRAILEVTSHAKQRKSLLESRDGFVEEGLVRRELSDNFCFYNSNYDRLEGGPSWGLKTLREHAKDKRPKIYSLKELESGKTYDELWNACQHEAIRTGKIHGYMRMYWAKQLLLWTETPEDALRIGMYLNDKYHMDGSDPNGYVGVSWSVTGVHDHGWGERPIFGKIRIMTKDGCRRKFNSDKYIKMNLKGPIEKSFVKSTAGNVGGSTIESNSKRRRRT